MLSLRTCLAFTLVSSGWNLASAMQADDEPILRAEWDAYRLHAPGRKAPPAPATRAAQLQRTESEVHALAKRGAFAAALQLIDEIDLLEPSAAPHAPLRLTVHEAAAKAVGPSPAALTHLKACLRHLPEDDTSRQVAVAEILFEQARRLADWESALHGASLLLLLEPARQEDTVFMQAAQEVRALASLRRTTDPAGPMVAANPR
jgi:hypothetical protein